MDLIVRSNPDKKPKINGNKLGERTKVFKVRKEARAYAQSIKSYVFQVSEVLKERNEKGDTVLVENHFGYGVPR